VSRRHPHHNPGAEQCGDGHADRRNDIDKTHAAAYPAIAALNISAPDPALVVRLRFDLVERVTATLDLGDDVVCGGFPDERFGVTVPMLGPGDDRVA